MLNSPTIVSSPGKVLISGGYLVLDRTYTGVVVGTSSRFYTIVKSEPNEHRHHQQLKYQQINLIVRSPQFIQAEWRYTVHLIDSSKLIIKPDSRSFDENKFVELAVRESLKLSLALQPNITQFVIEEINQNQIDDDQKMNIYTVKIDILGDNDFYSQPRQVETITPFNRLNTSLKQVHKTGLGSSAAMVTSLCSAILLHFTPSLNLSKPRYTTKLLLHNLSQYVHSLAQGKVGSGFDVSAAVWGSHVYRRFSTSCLYHLLHPTDDDNNNHTTTPQQLREVLDPVSNTTWTDPSTGPIVEQFSIPKYTTLILADVDTGSHTPSMVSKVLKWKNDHNQIANKIWNELSIKNDGLKSCFKKLEQISNLNEQEYLSNLIKLSEDSKFQSKNDQRPLAETDTIEELFVKISSLTKSIRKLMKDMGNQSNVPIEPDSQTKLLDACEKLDGVIGSGVPGAGGYDAIWVLIFTPPTMSSTPSEGGGCENVIQFLNSWPHSSVRVLSSDSWVVGGGCNKKDDDPRRGVVDAQAGDNLEDGIQIFDDFAQVDRLQCQLDLFC